MSCDTRLRPGQSAAMPSAPAWIDDIRIAVFDLDGTLYQALGLVERYLQRLADDVPVTPLPELRAEVGQVLAGEHALGMGAFYDRTTDAVIHIEDDLSLHRCTWEGEPLDDGEAIDFAGLSLDDGYSTWLTYISNPWNAAAAVCYHHGMSADHQFAVERPVRAQVGDPSTGVSVPSMLREVIQEGFPACTHRVLATNSYRQTVDPCLDRIGGGDVFDELALHVGKPKGMMGLMERLAGENDVEMSQIVTIGDNYWNDIWPATQLGCRTVLVDPFRSALERACDLRVETVDELGLMLAFR